MQKLISLFFTIYHELNTILGSFQKFITDFLSKLNKAHLIRRRTLELFLFAINYYIMADHNRLPKIIKTFVLLKNLRFILELQQLFKIIVLLIDPHILEFHFIRCECAGFVCEHIIYEPQLLNNRHVHDFALFVDGLIVHFAIKGNEKSLEEFN